MTLTISSIRLKDLLLNRLNSFISLQLREEPEPHRAAHRQRKKILWIILLKGFEKFCLCVEQVPQSAGSVMEQTCRASFM